MKVTMRKGMALWFILVSFAGTAAAQDADLVLKNGAVYTVDAARRWAEAIAIDGHRIVYVGSDAGAADHIGPRTHVIDLKGKMVLPGFQDAHVHPVAAGVSFLECALYDLRSKDEILAAVSRCAADKPDDEWIVGGGWAMDSFVPSGLPTKEMLDAIVSDRPAALESTDGHTLWVNSKSLEVAGIGTDTPDPEGGRIDRHAETGEPSGTLQEDAGMALVYAHVPPSPPALLEAGLKFAQDHLNQFGITAIQDALVKLGSGEPYASLDAYRALDERDELTLRVVGALYWESSKGMEQIDAFKAARADYARPRFQPTSVKIWADGVVETRTAYMTQPYVDRDGDKGTPLISADDLNRIVAALDREGFQIHIHAIGDATVRMALDSFETARNANGARDSRHHIAHLEFVQPGDQPRFRALNVVADFQPLWAFADDYITKLTLPIVDPEIRSWIYPIGSVMRTGAVVAFGSDWSVSSANPLDGIETAVTRLGPHGETNDVFLPDERIALHDALAAYTINAAYVNFLDQETGSIETGKLADLVVLDRNLFAVPPADISDAKVLLTLLDGEPVHGDFESVRAAPTVTAEAP